MEETAVGLLVIVWILFSVFCVFVAWMMPPKESTRLLGRFAHWYGTAWAIVVLGGGLLVLVIWMANWLGKILLGA
jgi:hypothetical protein